jgi:hypothetical protein
VRQLRYCALCLLRRKRGNRALRAEEVAVRETGSLENCELRGCKTRPMTAPTGFEYLGKIDWVALSSIQPPTCSAYAVTVAGTSMCGPRRRPSGISNVCHIYRRTAYLAPTWRARSRERHVLRTLIHLRELRRGVCRCLECIDISGLSFSDVPHDPGFVLEESASLGRVVFATDASSSTI